MGYIMTVAGEVRTEDIGAVLMHEHILCDFYTVSDDLNRLLDDPDLIVDELGCLEATPVRTVVEMTSVGLGRDLGGMRDIAVRTGLNIVAGCGWYRDPFLPQVVFETTSDGLADILISEINDGAGDERIRPGIIGEIGAKRSPMSPAEERVLRAGGFAQLQTGVSVYTHASRSTVGIEQAKILIGIGVPPGRIVIGHADTVPGNRREYWSELLDMGVTLGFDTVKPDFPYELGVRVAGLVWLAERGSLDQVVVSNDVCYRSHLQAFGGAGYPYCVTGFFDSLRQVGFGDREFQTIFYDTPVRLLEQS
jgi:phosphotriesterase-related protein